MLIAKAERAWSSTLGLYSEIVRNAYVIEHQVRNDRMIMRVEGSDV
jgi:hypothetical protein